MCAYKFTVYRGWLRYRKTNINRALAANGDRAVSILINSTVTGSVLGLLNVSFSLYGTRRLKREHDPRLIPVNGNYTRPLLLTVTTHSSYCFQEDESRASAPQSIVGNDEIPPPFFFCRGAKNHLQWSPPALDGGWTWDPSWLERQLRSLLFSSPAPPLYTPT